MKLLLRIVAIVLVLVVLAAAAAEFMLVRQARKLAAEGQMGLGEAAMLADPARIGGRLTGVTVPVGEWQQLELSEVDLWVPSLAWNVPHASLPAQVTLVDPNWQRVVTFAGGQVQARFSPFRNMALVAAGLDARDARLDDRPIAAQARIEARLTNYGAVVPAEVQAAYRIDSTIEGLNLPMLARMLEIGEPSGERAGATDIDGPLTLWVSNVITPRGRMPPRVLGASFDGLRISVDGAEMRVWGQLARTPSGMVNGELALDSTALRDFILGLAHAGYLPLDYAQLTATALETVAREAEGADPAPQTPISSPNLVALRRPAGNPHIPPRPEGVTRVPLRIEDGQIYLGSLALGALLQRGQP